MIKSATPNLRVCRKLEHKLSLIICNSLSPHIAVAYPIVWKLE